MSAKKELVDLKELLCQLKKTGRGDWTLLENNHIYSPLKRVTVKVVPSLDIAYLYRILKSNALGKRHTVVFTSYDVWNGNRAKSFLEKIPNA